MRGVLLAALLALGAAAAVAAPPEYTHVDAARHFSVLIPAGWKEVRLGGENPPKFAMVAASDGTTGERCLLAFGPGPHLSGLSQDQYKKFVRAGWFKKSLAQESFTLVSSELVDRGAYLMELDELGTVLLGRPVRAYRAATVSEGIMYSFVCMIHEANYASARTELSRIVRSFTVTP